MNLTIKTLLLAGLLMGLPYIAQSSSTDNHDEGHQEEAGGHEASEQDDHEGGHGESGGHEESGGHDEGGGEVANLSVKQMNLAEIEVARLDLQSMDYQVYAPGEIKANGYTSYWVSPRVDSVVLRRHVALGDHVKKGQALVTLFSEAVAEGQAVFRVANSEWKRVKLLGRKSVGDKRYIAAQNDYEASYARLKAYGLSESVLNTLSEKSHALGEYTLIALTSGAVLRDDFHQGQRVETGDSLMELAEEGELWVEARMTPNSILKLPSGSEAKIKVGNEWFFAQVTQEAHTIDPVTRTRVVRLSVNNKEHRLHPGMFADVYFEFVTQSPILAVPETALMRSDDGDWTVFVEAQQGQFNAVEVELGRSLGVWREIEGISPGSNVVVKGAFFVASEIAKGGFDPHGH